MSGRQRPRQPLVGIDPTGGLLELGGSMYNTGDGCPAHQPIVIEWMNYHSPDGQVVLVRASRLMCPVCGQISRPINTILDAHEEQQKTEESDDSKTGKAGQGAEAPASQDAAGAQDAAKAKSK